MSGKHEASVDKARRKVIQGGAGAGFLAILVASGIIRPEVALAAERNQAAFDMKNLGEIFKALGAGTPQTSADIDIKAPNIAENGAVVPVAVESKIPGTEAITILVAKNPTPLTASFDIPAGTEPYISTRVKMGETSEVYALVKANGAYFIAKKEIKVTLGGCGG